MKPAKITPNIQKPLKIILLLVLAAALIENTFFFLSIIANNNLIFGGHDWSVFAGAANNFLLTNRVFVEEGGYDPGGVAYKFPPFFVSLIIVCIKSGCDNLIYASNGLDTPTVRAFVIFLQIALFAISIGLCFHLCNKLKKFSYLLIALVAAINFLPFFENLLNLQLEIYIVFLLSVVLFLRIQNKNLASGIALGVAIGLKLYPAFFLIYFLLEKNTRALLGSIIGFLITIAISLAIISWQDHVFYFGTIAPKLFMEPIGNFRENISIGRILLMQGLPNFIVTATPLLIFVISFYVIAKKQIPTANSIATGFSILIAAFILASKNIWGSYQLLLLIPITVSILFMTEKKYYDKTVLTLVILSFFLLTLIPPRIEHLVLFVESEELSKFRRTLPSLLLWLSLIRLHNKVLSQS